MSKEKKHLIIITFQPLTKFISERFGLKVKKRNWNKKYLYILPLLNKKLFNQLENSGFRNVKNKNFYTIRSFSSLFDHIKYLKKNFFYINLAPGFVSSAIIEIILKLQKGKKIVLQHGYSLGEIDSYLKAFHELAKFDLIFSIKKTFFSIISLFKKSILKILYVSPHLYFCGNQLTYERAPVSKEKKFKTNSFDYNKFLLTKKNNNQKNDIVFLDSAIEDSFEYNLLGLTKNHFNKTLYWQAILEIFNKIEDQNNGKKIIIASHMRRNINDQPIKRKFIFDKTIDLIKNSKLVIAHNSLSLQWAILFKKPVVLIYVECFKYLAIENTREIKNLAKALDLKIIYVDKNFQVNLKKIGSLKKIKVNKKKYLNFVKRYTNYPNLSKKPKDQFLTVLENIDKL